MAYRLGWLHTGFPAWRRAMTDTGKVYEVGDAPSVAASSIVWPGGSQDNSLHGSGDSNWHYMHYGYGGSVYAHDLGAYGSMIFGTPGEATLTEQKTIFTLSDNVPTWQWFQQPDFQLTSAGAIAEEADWYRPGAASAEYLALSAAKKITPADPGAWGLTWDGTFPVGYEGWIMRRKWSKSFCGKQISHWFRYHMPAYIPASMTGTGAGAVLMNSRSFIYGPFASGHGPKPSTVADADWFADVWGTGRRKHYLTAQDVVTKVSQRIEVPIPDFVQYSGDVTTCQSAVDLANKRVYYLDVNSGSLALYYADFTSGIAGMTWSGPTNVVDHAGGPATSQVSNMCLAVPTSGPNAGRLLLFSKEEGAANLLLLDITNNAMWRLTNAGFPSNDTQWAFSYDPVTNRLFITKKGVGGTAVTSTVMTIPTDPTSGANYSPTTTTLSFASGVSLESGYEATWQYGGRSSFIPTLGVIFMTQYTGKMLAYRPA